MSLMCDWLQATIEHCITKALKYIREGCWPHSDLDELSVEYDQDVGNLYIRVAVKRYVQVIEWYIIGDKIQATLSDSYTSVDAAFSKVTLERSIYQPRKSIDKLPHCPVLQLLGFEIRVTNCFKPPRLTLWLEDIRLCTGESPQTTRSPVRSCERESVSRLLREFMNMESPNIAQAPLEEETQISPMRSQVGNYEYLQDNDGENVLSDPASQMELATQAPLSTRLTHSLPQAPSRHVDGRGMEGLLSLLDKPNALRKTMADKISASIKSAPAPQFDPPSRQAAPEQEPLSQAHVSDDPVPTAVPHLDQDVGSKSSPSSAPDSRSESVDRTCPTAMLEVSPIPLVRDGPQPSDQVADLLAGQSVRSQVEEQEPVKEAVNALTTTKQEAQAESEHPFSDPWRNWRGRNTIPQYDIRIPRSQLEILTNKLDDCWNPPLPGNRLAHPHVPIELLEKLNKFYDNEAIGAEIGSPGDGAKAVSQFVKVHALAENASESDEDRAPVHQTADLNAELDGRSETSEEIVGTPWSPTPSPSHRPRLPPDSSPLQRPLTPNDVASASQQTPDVNPHGPVLKVAELASDMNGTHEVDDQQYEYEEGQGTMGLTLTNPVRPNESIQEGEATSQKDTACITTQAALVELNQKGPAATNINRMHHTSVLKRCHSPVVDSKSDNEDSEIEIALPEPPHDVSQITVGSVKPSQYSTHIATSIKSDQGPSTVQVKRTPYPRAFHSDPEVNGRGAEPLCPSLLQPTFNRLSHEPLTMDTAYSTIRDTFTSTEVSADTAGPFQMSSPQSRQVETFEIDSSEDEHPDPPMSNDQNLNFQQVQSSIPSKMPPNSPSGQSRAYLNEVDDKLHFPRASLADASTPAPDSGNTGRGKRQARSSDNELEIVVKRRKTTEASEVVLEDARKVELPRQIAAQSRRMFFLKQKSEIPEQQSEISVTSPTVITRPPSVIQDENAVQSSRFPTPNSKSHNQVVTPPTSASSHRKALKEGSPKPPSESLRSESEVRIAHNLRHQNEVKSTAAEVYQKFKRAYADYGGNLKHFLKVCKSIGAGKAPHRSLWDDFIVRHETDYLPYGLACLEECEVAMPYEAYYNELISEPSHFGKIVTPEMLTIVLATAADAPIKPHIAGSPPSRDHDSMGVLQLTGRAEEDNKKATGRSLSVAGGGCPIPPNNLHLEKTQFSEDVSIEEEEEMVSKYEPPSIAEGNSNIKARLSQIEQEEPELRNSQSSSVRQWLEKSAGAPSPELGTPDEDWATRNGPPPLNLDVDLPPPHKRQGREDPDPGKRTPKEQWQNGNTPFKEFARSYASLKSERLGGPAEVKRRTDCYGIMKPFARKDWVDVNKWLEF